MLIMSQEFNNLSFLLFDFDGTIADTHKFMVKICNELSNDFGYNKIQVDEVELLKNKTSKEIIKYLNIPVLKIPLIIARAKQQLYKNKDQIQPIQGIIPALESLHNQGYQMGILSSNSNENINEFLKKHNCNFFEFIQSTSKIWSKHTAINKAVKQHNLNRSKLYYIGDEVRDIDAAVKSKVSSLVGSWGYNSRIALEKANPDKIFDKPNELLEFFKTEH